MSKKNNPLVIFDDRPCYEEEKRLIQSHKIFECESNGFMYDGFMQNDKHDGYLYVVKKRNQHGR